MIRTQKGFSFCDQLWLKIGWWVEPKIFGLDREERRGEERERERKKTILIESVSFNVKILCVTPILCPVHLTLPSLTFSFLLSLSLPHSQNPRLQFYDFFFSF